jgi:hypothetical protein
MFQSSAAISFNILLTVMILSPVPLAYRYMFVPLNIAVDSVVACLVFRGIKLGYIKDRDTDSRIPLNTVRVPPRDHPAATSVGKFRCYQMHNMKRSSHSVDIDGTNSAGSGAPYAYGHPQEGHDSRSRIP